ncbi:hypothetical protein [Sphingobacterium faecale]|uniref:HNH endonuclease n=1 Tax=Sphingobacterium faecale TaxID=2803775 RepID=A0ABS1R8U2_9SPHI|nr:hypothetical protein [Sphingobacterium faecale]MBL1411098.1 hypothetical protein [Sphingobacterium faecale]
MNFTEEDLQNIRTAQDTGGDIWNNELLVDLKARIKRFYRTNGSEVCCYCRRDFQDEFNMVIDIEHILPKSKYEEYMFEMGNLNISCKRCNMPIKGEKDDFVVDKALIRTDYSVPQHYYFIHPNFDTYSNNLDHFRLVVNEAKITKYIAKTNKGRYTYDYFKLSKLEVDSLNQAQGIPSSENDSVISDQATAAIKESLEILLSQL